MEALAYAWHYLMKDDSQQFATMSNSGSMNSEYLRNLLMKNDLSAAEIENALEHAPLSLIFALDSLAENQSTPEVGKTDISSRKFRFEIVNGQKLHIVYVVKDVWRASNVATLGQSHSPRQYHPNFLIFYENFDPGAGSRALNVQRSQRFNSFIDGLLESQDRLNVYLAEFPDPPCLTLTGGLNASKKKLFKVDGLTNETEICIAVKNHLDRAKVMGCNVAVFPELCMPAECIETVRQWFAKQTESELSLKFVVAGSFHVKDGEKFKNVCSVILSDGTELEELKQHKLMSFSDAYYVEDIDTFPPTVKILRSGIGLHASSICIDLASELPTRIPYNQIPLSWLWVPSMSGSASALASASTAPNLSNGTSTICANQNCYKEAESHHLDVQYKHTSFVTAREKTTEADGLESWHKVKILPGEEGSLEAFRVFRIPFPKAKK